MTRASRSGSRGFGRLISGGALRATCPTPRSATPPEPPLASLPAAAKLPKLVAIAVVLMASGCAARMAPPPPGAADAARVTTTYSARVRVSLDGPTVRARTPVLLAFRRPDALRIEVPGPTGARLIAVANGTSLVAVFPGERAVFEGAATESGLEDLLGVALTPGEIMDVLVGVRPARLRDYQAGWGPALPRTIHATLPDGARLKAAVEDPRTGEALPEAAFAAPPHDGYRPVDAEEARRMWSRR
jgi:hypothetical protein